METNKENNKKVEAPNGKNEFATNIAIGHDTKIFFRILKRFIYSILDITHGTDTQGAIEGIKKDIVFRGHSAWILIFSIFIASIGLNVNSTAVIIGAMLISPLMGPILGIGLSVGTNDWDTLVKSLTNFAIAIVISLLTSTIYFLITPLQDVQSELLARTRPTSLDVLIAFFGGFAGIIAGSRSEKTNVVPGVAIATALMPPLCTAGFGLATGKWEFFFGAFYLFFINSVCISISTFIVVRILHFPKKNFLNRRQEKRMKRYMFFFLLIVILPSVKIFIDVIKASRFNTVARSFIEKEIEQSAEFKGSEIISKKITYSDTLSLIDIYIIGDEIPQKTINEINKKTYKYELSRGKMDFWTKLVAKTELTKVIIHQSKDKTEDIANQINNLRGTLGQEVKMSILEDIYEKNDKLLKNKDDSIHVLHIKLNELIQKERDTVPFSSIKNEIKIQYPKLEKFAFAQSIETSLTIDSIEQRDTIPTFLLKWNKKIRNRELQQKEKQISNWLKVRLRMDTVRVIRY